MAGKFDNVPQSVREAISIALFVGAISATAAALLHQPLFILGGLLLFAIAYFVRIRPQLQQEYLEQEEYNKKYSADDSYQPILDRFDETEDDDALIDAYQAWKMGPYDNEVKLRFLQTAILALIDAGKIYRRGTGRHLLAKCVDDVGGVGLLLALLHRKHLEFNRLFHILFLSKLRAF